MSKPMIDTIGRTIHGDYQLTRKNSCWLLKDDVKLHIPQELSLGFSLDNEKKPPFAFFKDDPPIHMAKM